MSDKPNLSEISKGLAARYAHKAAKDANVQGYQEGDADVSGHYEDDEDHDGEPHRDREIRARRKGNNRVVGVQRAVRRLAKEEVEMIDVDESELAPNVGLTDTDPKTKVEMMARIVNMAASADQQWVAKWFKSMSLSAPTQTTPDSAEANKSSIDMKAGGNRQAAMPMVKLKEDVESSLFEGEEITEDAKERITTLFESAVNIRVDLIEAQLQEDYQAALTEEVATFIHEEKATLDRFATYVAEQWFDHNEVAIVDSLRLEIAEDFLTKVVRAAGEANVSISEENIDALHEVTQRNQELEAALEEMTNEKLELLATIQEKTYDKAFDEVSEGLTMVDREKFASLMESVDVNDVSDFEKKAKIIREKHFPAKTSTVGAKDVLSLNEENLTTPQPRNDVDPSIAALVGRMSPGSR